jgi:hypothetical protein
MRPFTGGSKKELAKKKKGAKISLEVEGRGESEST